MYNSNRLELNVAGTTSRTATVRKIQRFVLSTFLLSAGLATTPAFAAVTPPSIPDMLASSDSGASNTDNYTNMTQPVYTGTGTPYSTVTLYMGTNAVGFAIVPPSGKWTLAPNEKLKDSAYAVTVRQTTGGVQSGPSPAIGTVIDTVSPGAPAVPDLIARNDHGTFNFDDLTDMRTPTFQNNGVGAKADFIELYNASISKKTSIGTAAIDAQGQWKCAVTTPFPSGTHTYLVSAASRDLAGNLSPQSGSLKVVIDTDRPATASTPDLIDSDDSGVSKTDNITKVTLPRFTVHGDPGGKVTLYTAGIGDPTLIGSAIADDSGTVTIKATKPLVGNYVYAVNFDKAGNQALNSTPVLDVTIDTEAPPVPAAPVLEASSDGGVLGDNITNVKAPTVGGYSADINDQFYLIVNNSSSGGDIGKVDPATHHWTATPFWLPDGNHEICVLAIDRAGNVSDRSPVLHLTIDTTVPTTPSTPDLIDSDDSGPSNTDNITNKSTLIFRGTSQPSLKVVLYNYGVQIAETTADDKGQWQAEAVDIPLGSIHITAKTFTVAGSASLPTPQITGTIDVSLPSSKLTLPSNGIVQNLDSLSGVSLDSTVNSDASGVASVSMRITRLKDKAKWSGSQWTATTIELPIILGNGHWTKDTGLPLLGDDIMTQLQDGDYQIDLTTIDKAGNVRGGVGSVVTVDSSAPTVAITQPAQNAVLKGAISLDVKGTASDNNGITRVRVSLQRRRNNVMYYWNGNAFVTTPSSVEANVIVTRGKGVTWNCSDRLPHDSQLTLGTYVLYATAYDQAGNMQVSDPRPFTLEKSDVVVPNFAGSGGSA